MSIRIILADDHQIMREGLRLIFSRVADMEIIGEAGSSRAALELVDRLRPDVVVMDIGMPDINGMEATRQILAAHPRVRVIALSAYGDGRHVLGMLQAGAWGYVVKDAAGEDLVRAIRAAHQGKKYLSPEVAGVVVDDYVARQPAAASAYHALGGKEREVLQLLAEGKSSKQIAAELHVTVRTVESHRWNVMKKLGLHSLADLVKYALREGLTELDGELPPEEGFLPFK